MEVCALHAAYEHTCTETFTIGSSDEKQVRIALPRAVLRRGRVLVSGTSEIIWPNPNGETERARTDEQGRFQYKRPHAAGELMSVISPAGFFVTTQPPLEEKQPLEIAVPQGRLRSFEVKLASTASDAGTFTIALGDLVVPHEGFAHYLMRPRPAAVAAARLDDGRPRRHRDRADLRDLCADDLPASALEGMDVFARGTVAAAEDARGRGECDVRFEVRGREVMR